MKNKKAKQMIESLTGAYFGTINIPYYCQGLRIQI